MSASLKKLWNNYGIGAIVMAVILMYVIVLFYQYFSSKTSSGKENLNSYNNSAYSNGARKPKMASGGSSASGVKPANPSGQNETFASVKNNGRGGGGIPSACNKQTIQNPNDLLPKDKNSEWAQLNPAGQGDLSNINLLKAGYHIGIDTIGQTLRNANLQIRSEPANPQINVGPWNLSTIEPDFMRPPLELGQGIQ